MWKNVLMAQLAAGGKDRLRADAHHCRRKSPVSRPEPRFGTSPVRRIGCSDMIWPSRGRTWHHRCGRENRSHFFVGPRRTIAGSP